MLSFQTHPEEVKAMQDIINSGRFFSVTFIKADGTIRHVSGKKHTYQSDSPESEKRGKYNRLDKNILLIWDSNKTYTNKEGEVVRGAYIQARIDRILFFKSGTFTKNYTQENKEAIEEAGITQDQLENAMMKTNMSSMIAEEMESVLQEDMQFFTINDVPKFIKRMGFDSQSAEILKNFAIRAFKNQGDSGFVDWFKEVTGQNVYPVSRGKYSFQQV